MKSFIFYYNSPIGYLEIKITGERISCVVFVDKKRVSIGHYSLQEKKIIEEINKILDNFFFRKKTFSNTFLKKYVSIDNLHGTSFQKKVWNAIAAIPFGKTIDYTTLAAQIGNQNAVRAVGTACGKNPLALFIPCHRVVRKKKEDFGYSWGKERKQFLLSLEK